MYGIEKWDTAVCGSVPDGILVKLILLVKCFCWFIFTCRIVLLSACRCFGMHFFVYCSADQTCPSSTPISGVFSAVLSSDFPLPHPYPRPSAWCHADQHLCGGSVRVPPPHGELRQSLRLRPKLPGCPRGCRESTSSRMPSLLSPGTPDHSHCMSLCTVVLLFCPPFWKDSVIT